MAAAEAARDRQRLEDALDAAREEQRRAHMFAPHAPALDADATSSPDPDAPSVDGHRDPAAFDDDDDELECRVCRGEAEPDRPLFAPCKCSGSIRYTHSDCLEQWLEHSNKTFCELCGYQFVFTPLYDANAPDRLPWTEVVTTVLRMVVCKWTPFLLRCVLVVILWLGVAPWCTSWLYRMWLLRASAMVNVNFAERFDSRHVIADIFAGILLIVVIIFSFLALMSFADFLRFNLDHLDELEQMQQPLPQPQPVPQQQPLQPQPLQIQQQRLGLQRPMQGNPDGLRNVVGMHAIDEVDELDDFDEMGGDEREAVLRRRRPLHRDIGAGAGALADGAAIVDDAPRPQINPQRIRGNANNNNNNNNFNRDWDDDMDHMEINIAMDELLGLRGELVILFRNVSWLLAFNGAYLGLFAFIPYTLGSTLVTAGLQIFSTLPIASQVYAFLQDNGTVPSEQLPVSTFFVRMLMRAVTTAKNEGQCLQVVDLCTCAVGYVSICFAIVLWRWMVNTASFYIHRPLMGGLLWALRCLNAIVKVSVLLLLKMVVLPIMLGVGIDLTTLELFQVTVQHRIAFFMQHTVGALLVYWVLGITFMLFVTVFVLQLREVMHPDIFSRVIRPQEAHPDLLRSLLSEKSVKHARRMLFSVGIYAVLLLVLINIPIRIFYLAMPHLFPLELRFQHYIPELQVPLELLVVHLVVLSVLESAKNEIGRFQYASFKYACQSLGLSEYLLPRVEVKWNSRTLVRGAVHVLPPPPLHFQPQVELPPEQLRIAGHRYLPWPDEGFDDNHPVEYALLPRRTPSKLPLRVSLLLVASWIVIVIATVFFVLGALFVGRVCVGPLERVFGFSHDPLAMAAGVQIMWYAAHGVKALRILTLSEEHVEASLLERGYCVRNMSPQNAGQCVVAWALLCPILVGYLVSSCFPQAACTWFEIYWMGYILFNLVMWFVCCFNAPRRRGRRHGDDGIEEDDIEEDEVDDFIDEDFDDVMDQLPPDSDDEDEHDHDHDHEHELDGEQMAPQGYLADLRLCFKQLMFNMNVHDNAAVRLRNDNIHERCFDMEFCMTRVLVPTVTFLIAIALVCVAQSVVMAVVMSSAPHEIQQTAYGMSAIGSIVATLLLRSQVYISEWITAFAESIRNERYLIGRQLQDMVR